MRNESDFEDDGGSCAGASLPLEFDDTIQEELCDDARGSEAESACPDAAVPLPSSSPPPALGAEGDVLRDWQRHWRRLLEFSSEKTLPFDEVPQMLKQVCASVPAKLAEFFGRLAGAVDPGQDESKRGPRA